MKNLIVGIIISMLSLTATQVLAASFSVNNQCDDGMMMMLIPDIVLCPQSDMSTRATSKGWRTVGLPDGCPSFTYMAPKVPKEKACMFVRPGAVVTLISEQQECSCKCQSGCL